MSQSVDWDLGAAENLVAFLFPSWQVAAGGGIEVLQGVRHGEPTDYWTKATAEDLSNVAVRDQEILNALKNWKNDDHDTSFTPG
jgi:hypothetical protein